ANWSTGVVGTTPEYFDVRGWPAARGSVFAAEDVTGAAKLIVLGQTTVDKLFGPGINPIGRSLRLRSTPFQVLGVLARKGQSPMGSDYDDVAIVPATTFQTRIQGGLPKYIPGAIMVSATSHTDTARAQREIIEILRDRHHVASASEDDFSIRNLSEIA